MNEITVSIPGYGRAELTLETISLLVKNPLIKQIVVCDDCTPNHAEYNRLVSLCATMPKIRIVKNVQNWHNQHNKRNALSFSTTGWVLLIDNDNKFDSNFIDMLYAQTDWNPRTIYHPAFAAPLFDYRELNGIEITRHNVLQFIEKKYFTTLCNTNNYLVNRNEYLRVYEYNSEVRGADGIYFFYLWLKAGNTVKIVPDLTYNHLVHDGSEFRREVQANMTKVEYWKNKIITDFKN